MASLKKYLILQDKDIAVKLIVEAIDRREVIIPGPVELVEHVHFECASYNSQRQFF